MENIKFPIQKNDLITVFANKLILVLEDYFQYRANITLSESAEFRNIFFTLYIYGVEDNDVSLVTKDSVLQYLNNLKDCDLKV